MGKAYSDDLRHRVVAAMAAGRSCRDVGVAFDVAPSTAGNWYRRYRREDSHAARPIGGDRRSKLLEQAGWIGERLAGTPELTLDEVRRDLAGRGIEVSYASVWRTVRKLGLRHKKNVWPTPSARVMLDDVLVCINVSGLRASALAKMDRARHGPHKDGGVEHHIFAQAFATRGQPLRHLSFTSTDIVSGVGAEPAAGPGQAAMSAA